MANFDMTPKWYEKPYIPISIDVLRELFVFMEPTGSRYICNPPVMNTDEDWICLARPRDWDLTWSRLLTLGFLYGGSHDIHWNKSNFSACRKGELNLIVTSKFDYFIKFVAATEKAKELNLLKKYDRVRLFRKFFNEKSYDDNMQPATYGVN